MSYSALWFSQLQFFGSVSFMAVCLAMSLGLSWLLVYIRVRALGEQHLLWLPVYRFWVRIFALAFILSFASSMPVLIQLGSLWPRLLPKIHAVSGPILAMTLFGALVFKACFLGLMLYAQRQLSEWLHALVVCGVAVGNTFVALCLMVLVSWVYTPTGAQWIDGGYQVQHWTEVIFNPSFGWYSAQFFSASFLMVAGAVMAILSMQSLRRPLGEGERRVFKTAVFLGSSAWLVLAGVIVAAATALADLQPMKAAAAMGYWGAGSVPRWLWAAWPSTIDLTNYYELGWNSNLSWWLAHDAEGQPIGLDKMAGMTPPVSIVFWAVRLGLLTGLLMLFVLLKAWRTGLKRHYDPSALSPRARHIFVMTGFLGPLILLSGLTYHYFGAFPYVVGQTITFAEIAAVRSHNESVVSLVAYGVVHSLLIIGFVSLVRYVARYGVISVARRRGRA